MARVNPTAILLSSALLLATGCSQAAEEKSVSTAPAVPTNATSNPETERPAVIEAIEAQGFEVLGEFDAPSGLRGFAGVAGQQPVAVYATNDGEHAVVGTLINAKGERSEEHTSELQSLMRISYAAFCLKK